MTTQIDSANIPIDCNLNAGALASSASFTTGWQSTVIQNTAGYIDCLVNSLVLTGNASIAPAVGAYIGIWLAGANVSFAGQPIGGLNGTDSACVLSYASTLNSLRFVGPATAQVATAGLPYYIQPFSVAQQFGGIMPKFWNLYVAHNLGANLNALANRFSYYGITY